FRVLPGERLPAAATIALRTDPSFDRKTVEAAVTAALAAAFAPDRRAFAAPLAKSAILAVVQSVAGVIGARVDRLTSSVTTTDSDILGARGARLEDDSPRGAEFLTLDASGIAITEFVP